MFKSFALIWVIGFAASKPTEIDRNLFDVSGEDYEGFLADHNKALVFYHDPNSAHCKEIMKYVADIAKTFETEEAVFMVVDIVGYPEITNLLESKAAPQIRYYRNGEYVSFKWSFEKAELEQNCERIFRREPVLKEINSDVEYDDLRDNEEFAVILREDDETKLFARRNLFDLLSLAFDYQMYYTVNTLDISSSDTIYIHRKFDDGSKMLSDAANIESNRLVQFIEHFRYPQCQIMNEQNTVKTLANSEPFIALFVRSLDDPAVQNLRDAIFEAKTKPFCLIGTPRSVNADALMHQVGLKGRKFPKIGILDYGKEDFKKFHLFDVTKEAIAQFLEDYSKDVLPLAYREEPLPSYQDPIYKTIVRGNHDDIVFQPDTHVLVAYSTRWCEHCKGVPKAFQGVKNLLKPEVKNLLLGEMNADLNEIDGLKFKAFPTIYLYKVGFKHQPIEYEGILEPEVILNFIEDELDMRGKLYNRRIPDSLRKQQEEIEAKAKAAARQETDL